MSAIDQRKRFREHLAGDRCVQPASVFDSLSARIASALGFEFGMMAGSVASAMVLGAPDLTVITLSELAEQARRITRASDLSLIVDADNGYGNGLNVMRTVEELEAAGVSAMTIEDTLLPQSFGQQGESLISIEEMLGKLRAAVAARRDPTTVIIGRTAAVRAEGLDAAVARVSAFTSVGVDALFFTGVTTQEQVVALHAATPLPLLLGSTPTSLDDRAFLANNGVRIVLKGHLPFNAAAKAIYDALRHQKEGGSPEAAQEMAASDELIDQILQRKRYSQWQKEFLG